MIHGMTGFGKSKIAVADATLRVEIKTFNHKFFELSHKLPDNLQIFEEPIKKIVKKKIRRGKCYLWIQYEQTADKSIDAVVDMKKLQRYHALLRGIKKRFAIKDEITLTQLLSFPEVIVYKPKPENKKRLWQCTSQALHKALAGVQKMRLHEGTALHRDLAQRARNIEKALHKIKGFLPQEINRFRLKLKEKINNGLDKNSQRNERLEAEVALFAKNCDISEEITRLHAHIDNFRDTLKTKKEAGKVLDFIAQEMQREINTVGAKSSDFKIAKEVIFTKGEIEKIREQVQNIE